MNFQFQFVITGIQSLVTLTCFTQKATLQCKHFSCFPFEEIVRWQRLEAMKCLSIIELSNCRLSSLEILTVSFFCLSSGCGCIPDVRMFCTPDVNSPTLPATLGFAPHHSIGLFELLDTSLRKRNCSTFARM